MTKHTVDIAIIGAGSAGMSAYYEASKYSDSIALIEGGEYGTTCARVGCMPSKLLIAPALARHAAQKYNAFGLVGDIPKVDGRAVMQRVRNERDRFVGSVKKTVKNFDKALHLQATATFENDHILALSNGEKLQADRIIIATGSHPNIAPPLKDAGKHLITSDDVFYWEDLPQSIAVVGAGVVGLELAQALHRLGVNVHLFGRDNQAGIVTDPEIRTQALDIFTQELQFFPDSHVVRTEEKDDKAVLYYTIDDKEHHVECDYVLATTGRTPNIDTLSLHNTGLELDDKGMPIYDPMSGQCGDSHIFIAGDVNGDIPLLHEASDEGRIAGKNAGTYPQVLKQARRTPLTIIFPDPQMAIAGQSYQELCDMQTDFSIGSCDFEHQGRARVMMDNVGLLHIYGDNRTGRILGAEMIGHHHEHLAHLISWCITMHITVHQALLMPFYHPTIEEGMRTALRDLLKNMNMSATPPEKCMDCGVGS